MSLSGIEPATFRFVEYTCNYQNRKGTAVVQRLRYCATNRKVAGSIPDGIIVMFP
jgi:hypothetical protein